MRLLLVLLCLASELLADEAGDLLGRLRKATGTVRLSVVYQLGLLADASSVRTLVSLQQHADWRVRHAAAISLAKAGQPTHVTVRVLVRSLRRGPKHRLESLKALQVLGTNGARALPALVDYAFSVVNDDLMIEVLIALARVDPEFAKSLDHPTPEELRRFPTDPLTSKALAIGRMDMAWLIAKLRTDPNLKGRDTRRAADWFLPRSIPRLAQVVTHRSWRLRALVARRLGETGMGVATIHLQGLLEDPNTGVRSQAIRSLGTLGARAVASVPALLRELLKSSTRGESVNALNKIGAGPLLRLLDINTRTLTLSNSRTRGADCRAMLRMFRGERGACLLTALRDVIRVGPEVSLRPHLADSDVSVKECIAFLIGRTYRDRVAAAAALRQLERDASARVRRAARAAGAHIK